MGGIKKLHSSWHIAWASVGFIGGVALSAWVAPTFFAGWEVPVFAICIGLAGFVRKTKPVVLALLCAGMLLGLWRGSTLQVRLDQYQVFYGKSVEVVGVISEDTSYNSKGNQRLSLKNVLINNKPVPETVWVTVAQKDIIKRGDRVMLRGKLSEGFGITPASMHQAEIVSVDRIYPGDVGRRARDWFAGGIRSAISEPQASLASGFLLGQKSALPENLTTQLQIVGLTHVVVASGYNLTILVSLARRSLAKLSKYLAAFSASSMVIIFVLITGFSPSMSRAGIIALLSLAAWYYGRVIHPVVLLLFVAALTAFLQPAYVWGDVGWYLSFAAFAGVIILAPLVHRYFWGKTKRVNILRQIAVDTMAAQLLTIPIILLTFGTYSTYALLANILILPLVPLVMLLTAIAGLTSLLLPLVHQFIGLPAELMLRYMTSLIDKIAKLPNSQGEVSVSILMVGIMYAFITAMGMYMWKKTDYNFSKSTPESELYTG